MTHSNIIYSGVINQPNLFIVKHYNILWFFNDFRRQYFKISFAIIIIHLCFIFSMYCTVESQKKTRRSSAWWCSISLSLPLTEHFKIPLNTENIAAEHPSNPHFAHSALQPTKNLSFATINPATRRHFNAQLEWISNKMYKS